MSPSAPSVRTALEGVPGRPEAGTALRESEEHFRLAQEMSPDGFMLLRAVRDAADAVTDFEWLYLNPAAIAMIRPVAAAQAGCRLRGRLPEAYLAEVLPGFIAACDTGEATQREVSVRCGGGARQLQVLAVRVGDGCGVTLRDVTARHGAEHALRLSEERFRSIMERAADLVAILGTDGTVRYASPSYDRGLGYDPATLLGTDGLALLHPEDYPRVAEQFRTVCMTPGAAVSTEFRARHADGLWRTISTIAQNLTHVPGVGGILVSGHDTTAKRSLEAQLRQSQKLEAIGRLAGGVAHDFNNLLTVIQASAEFIALEVSAPVRDDVDQIRAATHRAAALTRQLLAFSRKQILAPRVIDLNAVVSGLHSLLARLIGEDIPITLALGEVGRVLIDPGQLEQVLMNLAVNSRDAMPQGGRLTISTGSRLLTTDQRAANPGLAGGRWATIAVADSGVGMTAETIAQIFEPFFTTKGLGEGTGLGLATVYGIMQQSGGFVEVESAAGQGSTFTLYLPTSEPAVPDDLAPPPPNPTVRGEGPRPRAAWTS